MKPEFRENVYSAFATVQLASMANSASTMAQSLHMPTQLKESQLGYDASMKVKSKVVYLQYKVSDYLNTPNAKQYYHHNGPYYRFRVKTDKVNNNIQHNALCNLQKNAPNAIVRYCAPIFHTMQELADIHFPSNSSPAQHLRPAHALSGTPKYGVLDHSVLISPTILGPVQENSSHVMTYSARTAQAVAFSSPQAGTVDSFEEVIENAARSSERSPLSTVLRTMIADMQEAIDRSIVEYGNNFNLSPDKVPLVAKQSNYSKSFYIAEALRLSDMIGVRPLILTSALL
ncbi:hypothetical protein ACTXJ8_14865 [Corynebacterium variabile]|uniref:hypothetical protein n=1 Tax=Corynebacterium variabile TaxID=1727 RepID=UPI003FCFCCF8